MVAARELDEGPYEDGAGFGKFRKRPFRRTTQSTPHDRPPTAVRNAGHGNGSKSKNGWLSKLVEPAQRLIACSAHRLFPSVFRKRLPLPLSLPSQPLEPVITQRTTDEQHEAVLTGPPVTQGAAPNGSDTAFNISDQREVAELELILKQKTFTRSEIDRLTALLQSRSVDLHAEDEEKKSELITSKAELSQDRKEDLPIVPVIDNGLDSHVVSTPIVASKVVDEDVATPAELAKAYMCSRPSKMSPSMLFAHDHSCREGSSSLSNKVFLSDSPIQSIISQPSCRAGFPVNGFVTPRSQGRSAIYGMARMPYFRVQPTTALQGSETAIDAFGGPSSSLQNTWENFKYSGSKHGPLKRRSSVLENDIGSMSSICRIRKKSGILPYSGALSIHGIDISSDSNDQPVSTLKPALMGQPLVQKDNRNIHHSGLRPVPSKSSEMASKILQQLDVIVSPKEKSMAKVSPFMLRGPAHRSLNSINSSKILENVQDNKLDVEHETCLPNAQDLVSQEDGSKENGPLKYNITCDKSASAVDVVEPTRRSGVTDVSTVKSVFQPPQNKRSFRMSAHEDYLDLDDDDVAASATLAEGRQKLDATVVGNKTTAPKIRLSENIPASSEVNQPASSILNQKSAGDADGSMVTEKNAGFTFQAATFPSMTVQQTVVHSLPTVASEAALPKKSQVALPIFSFEEKVSPEEQNGIVTPLENNIKTAEKVPQLVFASSSAVVTDLAGPKFNHSSDAQPERSSRLLFVD
uniref:Nuclear pore complex protein NUP1-like isoform X2 n=1 Tax=Rhizophora mucronata TaxID=61149 RepID=A0A2P2LGH0_RHIMU